MKNTLIVVKTNLYSLEDHTTTDETKTLIINDVTLPDYTLDDNNSLSILVAMEVNIALHHYNIKAMIKNEPIIGNINAHDVDRMLQSGAMHVIIDPIDLSRGKSDSLGTFG